MQIEIRDLSGRVLRTIEETYSDKICPLTLIEHYTEEFAHLGQQVDVRVKWLGSEMS